VFYVVLLFPFRGLVRSSGLRCVDFFGRVPLALRVFFLPLFLLHGRSVLSPGISIELAALLVMAEVFPFIFPSFGYSPFFPQSLLLRFHLFWPVGSFVLSLY